MSYSDRPWLKSYDKGVPADITIPDETYLDLLLAGLRDQPNRPALHFMGNTLTFGQLDDLSSRFAAYLQQAGLKRGDVVGINLPNLPQFPIAIAGTIKIGCTVTGVSPLLSGQEMAHQLKDSDVKALVTLDAIYEHKFFKYMDDVPDLSVILPTGITAYMPKLKGFFAKLFKKIPIGKVVPVAGRTIADFKFVLDSTRPDYKPVRVDPQELCLIQYTGGTTGLPKGAQLSHRNIVANNCQVQNWLKLERGKEVFCFGFPFFHQAGMSLGMLALAFGGTQILIPDPRNTNHICGEIRKYKPTGLGNVPSLYQMLVDNPKFRKLDFSNLKFCGSGAAPFSIEGIHQLEAVVGKGMLMEAYGMTETSPFITFSPHETKKKIGSVGLPLPSTYIKIVDIDTGTKEVPLGEEGELICNGPQVMIGYHNSPEETDHAIREIDGKRWLFTGDIGLIDEKGFVHIVDRAKDMLIVNGFKVFSREVEEKLYELPFVELCAIVGLPNPERPGSEIVKCVIQTTDSYKDKDRTKLKAEVLDYCKENMAPYKVPKAIEFIDEIPLTAVGKVDKKSLRN